MTTIWNKNYYQKCDHYQQENKLMHYLGLKKSAHLVRLCVPFKFNGAALLRIRKRIFFKIFFLFFFNFNRKVCALHLCTCVYSSLSFDFLKFWRIFFYHNFSCWMWVLRFQAKKWIFFKNFQEELLSLDDVWFQ